LTPRNFQIPSLISTQGQMQNIEKLEVKNMK
jgi:hypothetical protein